MATRTQAAQPTIGKSTTAKPPTGKAGATKAPAAKPTAVNKAKAAQAAVRKIAADVAAASADRAATTAAHAGTAPRPAIDGAQYLPLNLIAPSPANPRKRIGQAALEELADSIERLGVLQPILVRPRAAAKRGQPLYEIVAGERRWRASTLLAERLGQRDIATIPAIVRAIDDFEALQIATVENLQRENLHPLEEAEGYEALLLKPVHGADFSPPRTRGYTVDELAARVGKSRSYIFGRLKLCGLCPEARDAFFADRIATKAAEAIARIADPAVQASVTAAVLQGWGGEPLTFRQTLEHIQRNHTMRLGSVQWMLDDAALHPAAGPCTTCPKRSGANPELFGEHAIADDLCTDIDCFKAKGAALHAGVLALHQADGHTIVAGAEARALLPTADATPRGHYRLDAACAAALSHKPLGELIRDTIEPAAILAVDVESAAAIVECVTSDNARAALRALDLLRDDDPAAGQRPAHDDTAAAGNDEDGSEPHTPTATQADGTPTERQRAAATQARQRESAIERRWRTTAIDEIVRQITAPGSDADNADTIAGETVQRLIARELLRGGDFSLRALFDQIELLPFPFRADPDAPFDQPAADELLDDLDLPDIHRVILAALARLGTGIDDSQHTTLTAAEGADLSLVRLAREFIVSTEEHTQAAAAAIDAEASPQTPEAALAAAVTSEQPAPAE